MKKTQDYKIYPQVSTDIKERANFFETFTVGLANKSSTLIVVIILAFIIIIPIYMYSESNAYITTHSNCIEDALSKNTIVVTCNSDAKDPTTNAIIEITKKGFNLKNTINEGDKYIMYFVQE